MQTTSLPYFADSWVYVQKLASMKGLIWFHEGPTGNSQEWLSADPDMTATYWGNERISVEEHGISREVQDDFFSFLQSKEPSAADIQTTNFVGGLAGHLSYNLGLELLNVRSRHLDSNRPPQPLAVVSRYLWAVNLNHKTKTAEIVFHDDCPESLKRTISSLFSDIKNTDAPLESVHVKNWECAMSRLLYSSAFANLKEYIVEGDVYQANLTRQWRTEVVSGSDLETYRQITHQMPAPFSMFHRTETHSLLSVSPERFIQISEGTITTQPIKGTRPRDNDPIIDLANQRELVNSTKDRAENLMIVDLLRNDIAKNAEPGSVNVTELFNLQSFKNVHHLVSTVVAQLKTDRHPFDVLRDAFPGGSITGTPKKRAMEIIDELEVTHRGNYCGTGFYLNATGRFDSNILIRSLTLSSDELTCSGGGGIVHDSIESEEYQESDVKVRRIMSALSGQNA